MGVVLVGVRIAEIHEDPVAQKLGDVPVETADDLVAEELEVLQEVAKVFRVELGRQGRRADDVAEDDVHRASLRPSPRRGVRETRATSETESCDDRVGRVAFPADQGLSVILSGASTLSPKLNMANERACN
jgi:hypothetical protein